MNETLETVPKPSAIVQRSTGYPDLILIEDNPHDVQLIRLAILEVGIQANLHVAEDSVRAFELMAGLAAPPAVVVLDLNLPLIKGASILCEIRHGSRWKDVPVIILTSSQSERDIEECIKLGATAYKSKPALFEGYVEFARSLVGYLSPP
ncbi:MAG: response regulator [Planctomycetes bacterium]|nr:response regulator [Planctomycetota bacterium]